MLLAFFSHSLSGNPLEIGSEAPDVVAKTHQGDSINLRAALAEGTTLVFFYPKAFTPGCTRQACSLRDNWSELEDRGVRVFGVSSDSVEKQAKFKERHELPYTLIADSDHSVAKAFGKSRWQRQAYIFVDGKLVWRDLKGATASQADEAIAALDALKNAG